MWTEKGKAPYSGEMAAAAFAKLMQDSVDAQLALAATEQ